MKLVMCCLVTAVAVVVLAAWLFLPGGHPPTHKGRVAAVLVLLFVGTLAPLAALLGGRRSERKD
jgi:peptidoglycan biosynthesis protein MviN/MurJ (putative lipid II flippase)